MSKRTPVSVRCARWAAVAAAITALGSCFNTMWTSKPWWKDSEPKTAMVQSVHRTEAPPPPQYSVQESIGEVATTSIEEKPWAPTYIRYMTYSFFGIFVVFICMEGWYRYTLRNWSVKLFWKPEDKA